MTLALVRKFFQETRAVGLGSALRKTVCSVGRRCGLASLEQLEIVVYSRQQEEARLREQMDALQAATASAIQTLSHETSSRQQEEARLREQMDALQQATASAVQTLGHETSARHQEEARLREQMDALQEAIASARATLTALENQRSSEAAFADASELRALTLRIDTDAAKIQSALAVQSEAIGWLAEHHWTTGPLNPPSQHRFQRLSYQ